jgi:hypothetical protein
MGAAINLGNGLGVFFPNDNHADHSLAENEQIIGVYGFKGGPRGIIEQLGLLVWKT